MDPDRFLQLLESILTPDTDRVKTATATLRKDYYNKPGALLLLLKLITSHDSPALRQLAAVEARTLVPKHWAAISSEQKVQIRTVLLKSTLNEESTLVRHSSARVVSAIAKLDVDDGEWAELPGFLQQAATSQQASQREVGVYILFTLLEVIGDGFVEKLQDLFALFAQTIRDPESADVRVHTMLALSKIAMIMDPDEDPQSLAAFRATFPDMVKVLKAAIDAGDEDRTMQAFEVFQTLLGCDSQLMVAHFKDLVQFMIDIAVEKHYVDDTRSQALSFLMQCIKYRKLKMQGLKFGEQLTIQCLQIATELDELQNEDDEVTPAASALGLLDILAQSLPPSQVIVPLLRALPPYFNSPDADHRRAGILALGMCVEGAPEFVSTQLHEIFPVVFRLLEDPEIRVRQAALHAVARLADDLAEQIGEEHVKLIPALIKNLDSATEQVRNKIDSERQLDIIKACCAAIDSVFEGIEREIAAQYVGELVPRLSRLFGHPDFKIKAVAASAMGTVAAASKDAFLPFFEEIMHELSNYVSIKDSQEELELRGNICDALGSIASAVGPVPFQPYVRPLMAASEEAMHLDHTRLRETSYILWSTLVKVYEEEFTPFLDGVVKGLVHCLELEETDLEVELGEEARELLGEDIVIAGKRVKVSAAGGQGTSATLSRRVAEANDDDDDDDDDDADDVEFEDVDGDDDDDAWDELTGVTAVALEKEIALDVIADVLTHTRSKFVPYLEQTVELAMGLVEHPFEGCRKSAIGVLWRAHAMFWTLCEESGQLAKWQPGLPVKVRPNAELEKLGEVAMTATLAIWGEEMDRATVTDINQNLAAALKKCGPAILSSEKVMEQINENLVSIMRKQHSCQQDLGEDEDFEGLEESSEYDWLLIDSALEVVIGLTNALGPSFNAQWKIFEKPLMKFASSSESIERSTVVGVIAEVMNAMGPTISPSTTPLLKMLLHRLSDSDPEVRSNAAFATGVLCKHSTSTAEITRAYPQILQKLEPLLHQSESLLTDNSAGCVARMMLAHPGSVPTAEVLPVLVDLLPLKEDWEENEVVWSVIVKLYQAGEPTVKSLTPQIVAALAEVFRGPKEQLTDERRAELHELVRWLHGKSPRIVEGEDVLEAIVAE